LLVNRSDSPRLEIRSHGILVEVVDSDPEMIYLARRIFCPQNQKVFPKHELVVSVPLVDRATECALVEIRGSFQIADEQRDVIDAVTLESRRLRGASARREHSQSLDQISP
jgi:hypothetical protein